MTEVTPGAITCASPYRTAWWSFGRAWGIASAKAGLLLKCWRIEHRTTPMGTYGVYWKIWEVLGNMGNIGNIQWEKEYIIWEIPGWLLIGYRIWSATCCFGVWKGRENPSRHGRTLKGSSFPNLSRYAKMFQTAWDVLLKQATSKVLRSIILVLRLLELAGQQFLYRSSNYI